MFLNLSITASFSWSTFSNLLKCPLQIISYTLLAKRSPMNGRSRACCVERSSQGHITDSMLPSNAHTNHTPFFTLYYMYCNRYTIVNSVYTVAATIWYLICGDFRGVFGDGLDDFSCTHGSPFVTIVLVHCQQLLCVCVCVCVRVQQCSRLSVS